MSFVNFAFIIHNPLLSHCIIITFWSESKKYIVRLPCNLTSSPLEVLHQYYFCEIYYYYYESFLCRIVIVIILFFIDGAVSTYSLLSFLHPPFLWWKDVIDTMHDYFNGGVVVVRSVLTTLMPIQSQATVLLFCRAGGMECSTFNVEWRFESHLH